MSKTPSYWNKAKKYLRLNLFDANINYNSGDNFKNRLIKIEKT